MDDAREQHPVAAGRRGFPERAHDVVDPTEVLNRIVRGALTLLPHSDGAAVLLLDSGGLLTNVCAAGTMEAHIGIRTTVDASICGLALRTQRVMRCDDTEIDARVDREAVRETAARSGVTVPLIRSRVPVGVFAVTASMPHAFDEGDVAVLSELAGFVTTVVGSAADTTYADAGLISAVVGNGHGIGASQRHEALRSTSAAQALAAFVSDVLHPSALDKAEARVRIKEVLGRDRLPVVYQPIFDLETGRLMSAEALLRLGGPPPHVWFADAEAVGLGVELELAALRSALTVIGSFSRDVAIAINVGPKTIGDPQFQKLLRASGAHRVIVELTEHTPVEDYELLGRQLSDLRRMGVRLAVDDTGAGYASLLHILKLAPEFIKLDLQLTSGIDVDPVRQALASALISFAARSGARVVAEGIETQQELAVVRELGTHYGQGFHLARPTQIETLDFAARISPSRRPKDPRGQGAHRLIDDPWTTQQITEATG